MIGNTADDARLWCRRYHEAPAGAGRLVCFPHAGGSASFYFPVSRALGSRVDVVAVQYPGRQDRRSERPIDSMAELADRVTEALAGETGRPLTFFGHSLGAVLAFEVAVRLEAAGHTVSRLFASGRRAPSTFRDEQLHLRDDRGLMAELRGLSGTDTSVLQDEEMMQLILPALRADYRAVETYRCDPSVTVRCPISVIVGDQDPKTTVDEARAWAKHTTGEFDLQVVAGGGHFYLTAPARAAEVNRRIDDHITQLR